MKFCSKCGAKLRDEAKFCDKCGQAVENIAMETDAETKVKSKKPLIIGILSVVLVITITALIFAVINRNKGSVGSNRSKTPGLYGDDGKMLESWDDVMREMDIKIRDGELRIKDETDDIEEFPQKGIDSRFETQQRVLVLPENVTSIGDEIFQSCDLLTGIEMPDGVISIGERAFDGCESLTSIEIPDSVTSIGKEAFTSCNSLTSIEIPNRVTSIGERAFRCCESLTSIEIPDSVTSIGDSAFSGCDSLTEIQVTEGNPVYDSREDCNAVIEKESNTLIVGCKGTKIPSSVTSIRDHAFWDCGSLTSIEIPDSVTEIGESAFGDCDSLTSIEIPNSVTSIGETAFDACSSLTSIKWHGIVYDDQDAFYEDFRAGMTPAGTSASTQAPEENQINCAEEAYKAYKKAIKPNASKKFWKHSAVDGEYASIGLFYLDADDYPEFLWYDAWSWMVLTYKQGKVSKLKEGETASLSRFSCKERQGYMLTDERIDPCEIATISYYDGMDMKEVWRADCLRYEDYFLDENGKVDKEKKKKVNKEIKEFEKNLAAQIGNEADWTEMVNWSDEKNPNPAMADTLEDAYDKFLKRVNLYNR